MFGLSYTVERACKFINYKVVARLHVTAALGSNPDTSQKYQLDDISKGVANTLKPAKKYTKNYNLNQNRSNFPYAGLPDLHLGSYGAHLYQVPAGLDHLGRSRYVVAELPTCFRVRGCFRSRYRIYPSFASIPTYLYLDQFRMENNRVIGIIFS